jgi:hypothetical protein
MVVDAMVSFMFPQGKEVLTLSGEILSRSRTLSQHVTSPQCQTTIISPMSEHNLLIYFPESPADELDSIIIKDSFYVRQALKDCAVELNLTVQKDMYLIAVSPHRWHSYVMPLTTKAM